MSDFFDFLIEQGVWAPGLSAPDPVDRTNIERHYATMIAALPYERQQVDGRSAVAEWKRLKTLGKGWPVIVGDDESLERIADQFFQNDPAFHPRPAGVMQPALRTPQEILDAAELLRFPEDTATWVGGYRPEDLRARIGAWPKKATTEPDDEGLCVARDSNHVYFEKVHVLFVPAKHSWEVPAYLRWGDWNACPPPEYHVAALRHWDEKFGIELVGVNGDRMDLHVDRPPVTRREALLTAKEMYPYCPDIVDQGTRTLARLAAQAMGGWWSFWWD